MGVIEASVGLVAHLWDRLAREKERTQRRAKKLTVKYSFKAKNEQRGYDPTRKSVVKDMPSLHLYKKEGSQLGMVQKNDDREKLHQVVMDVLEASGELANQGTWRMYILNIGAS